MAADHALVHAHTEDLHEHLLEHLFGKQLAGPAYSTVPGQLPVDIVTYEKQNIQSHRTMGDKMTVADDVLRITDQAQLEENDRVDALLAAIPIITLGQRIQKSPGPIPLSAAYRNCSLEHGHLVENGRTTSLDDLSFPAYPKLRSIPRSAMITTGFFR